MYLMSTSDVPGTVWAFGMYQRTKYEDPVSHSWSLYSHKAGVGVKKEQPEKIGYNCINWKIL